MKGNVYVFLSAIVAALGGFLFGALGYEDGDVLRFDPAFKLACGRWAETGAVQRPL